jgi:hypothetical protein
MTLTEFFKQADIRFLDELTIPRRALAPASRRRSSSGALAGELSFAETYVASAVLVPALEVLGGAARQAQERIDALRAEFAQAEADAGKVPPSVFDDWELGSDEDRQELAVRRASRAGSAGELMVVYSKFSTRSRRMRARSQREYGMTVASNGLELLR